MRRIMETIFLQNVTLLLGTALYGLPVVMEMFTLSHILTMEYIGLAMENLYSISIVAQLLGMALYGLLEGV